MTVTDIDPLAPRPWSDRFQEIRERGCSTFESMHRTKDGEIFPVEVTADYVTLRRPRVQLRVCSRHH